VNLYKSTITPTKPLLEVNLREIFLSKDLLFLFVKRDFISVYKQTVLGPMWFFIQPILTTLMFTIVFGKVAGLPTDGIPKILFYLAGLTCWNYFADCLTKTSTTFVDNQEIFGKVYFPRLITPLSIVISSLIKFGIQFLLFTIVLCYYLIARENNVEINRYVLLFPLLLVLMGGLGLGLGIIITSLTTKYRDLRFLILFGIQLWMYATPVIYPLSSLDGLLRKIALLNPMTSIIETFKYAFIGSGSFSWPYLGISTAMTFIVLVLGIFIFNKTEQNFMDTI